MNNNPLLRREAVKWLNGDRAFERGISILQQSGFKPGVVAKLARVGADGPEAAARLQYLIREYISVFGQVMPEDTDAELHVFHGKESPADQPVTKSKAIMAVAERVAKKDESVPTNIAKLVNEYACAYKLRDQAFRAMGQVNEDNSEKSMEMRRRLSDTIDATTERMEKLYPYYERWLNDQAVPTDEELATIKQQPKPEKTVKAKASDGKLIDMPASELRTLKKSLKTKILRARNMLDYQQETKGARPNPMPEGARRIKYETKIKNLSQKVEDVEMILAQIS